MTCVLVEHVIDLDVVLRSVFFFFFNDTATTEIYTSFPTRRSSDLMEAKRSGPPWTAKTRARFRVFVSTDRKSTRLNSSHLVISYAVFCLKKKKHPRNETRRGFDISTIRLIMNAHLRTLRSVSVHDP